PEVRAHHRQVGREIPLVGCDERGFRTAYVKPENAVPADGVCVVVSFRGDIHAAGRVWTGERHPFGIGTSSTVAVEQILSGAPVVPDVGRPNRAVPHEAEQRTWTVADSPEDAGRCGSRALVDQPAQIATENIQSVNCLDFGVTGPWLASDFV